ncbi:MAG: hypothetical protein DRP96_05820 [Candidatus Neomarinimicrobiota bacterium]|nr:MAG: hypothetical protein DRP96_05820 [Candidatus Neomarinimicrobiota bacterium]
MEYQRLIFRKIFPVVVSVLLASCAYYNTFYNAEQYFKKGIQEIEAQGNDRITVNIRKYFNSAIEKSNKVLINYPDSRWTDNAAYIIAMSHYYKTDYSTARKNFEQFFANYPASDLRPRAEIWYGRCLWKLGEKEQALRQLLKSSQREKNPQMRSEIFFALADLYRSSGELDSALIYYQKTISAGRDIPQAASAQYKIAEINLAQNNIDLAITNLKKIYKYHPSSELIDKMQILLARIYREDNRFDEARTLIDAKLNDISNEAIWGDLELQLALLYLAEGDLESARLRFSQITEKYKGKPVSSEAYYHLGELYMNTLNDYERAKTNYEKVKKEDRNSRFALSAQEKIADITKYFALRKKYEETWKTVKIYIDNAEGNIDSSNIKNTEEEDSDEIKKALEQFQRAKAQMADTVTVFKNYYQELYELGEMHFFNFGNTDSAFYYFNRIYRTPYYNPVRDKALYALYFLLKESGKDDLADSYLDSMRLEFPDSQYLRFIEHRDIVIPEDNLQARQMFLRAESYFDFQPDSAITVYSEIADKYPDTKYAEKSLLAIGWLYHYRLYNLGNSIKYYEKFLEKYPESDLLEYGKKELNDLQEISNWITSAGDDSSADSTGKDFSLPDSSGAGDLPPDEADERDRK